MLKITEKICETVFRCVFIGLFHGAGIRQLAGAPGRGLGLRACDEEAIEENKEAVVEEDAGERRLAAALGDKDVENLQ